MRKWLVRLAVAVAFIAVAVGLRLTVFAAAPLEVQTVPIERGRVEETATNSKAGTIEARRRAKLSPGTSGIVVELLARRGRRVSKGDVLLRIDDATQRATLLHAERSLAVAEATHRQACIAAEQARRELERNRGLAAEEVVSENVLDRLQSTWDLAVAECDVAAAGVERAAAAVEQARAELEKTTLRAPFDAVIAEDSVEVGEWVTPSVPLLAAPDVLDAIDTSSLYVSAPMDEVDAAVLEPGLPVRVTIDTYPERSFAGSIVRVAPYVLDVEQQNRTIEIEVELDDKELASKLLPGTSADVEVILSTRDDVLRVPTHALLERGVVLVVAGDVLEERQVELGLRNWDFAEVVSGLAQGDRVVTSLDRAEVRAGARVEVTGSE